MSPNIYIDSHHTVSDHWSGFGEKKRTIVARICSKIWVWCICHHMNKSFTLLYVVKFGLSRINAAQTKTKQPKIKIDKR